MHYNLTRACGKSSLTIRLTDERFSDVHDVTIAAEIGSKIVQVADNQHIKLQIWDTAGQEHFRAVTRSYFRNAAGCLLVYDVTRRQTFAHVQDWLNDILEQAGEDITICLVGNKSDLEDSRQVTADEAEQWAKDNGIQRFVETSAKTGENVIKAYEEVARLIHENIVRGKYDLNDRSHGVKVNKSSLINLNVEAANQKRSCC